MFDFVANLKPYTFHRGRGVPRFPWYLISTDFMREGRGLIRKVHRAELMLVADNGNLDMIKKLAAQFSPEVAPLHDRRRAEEKELGRKLRPGDISPSLRKAFVKLQNRLDQAAIATRSSSHLQEVMNLQESSQPGYRVGGENLAMAALTGLGVQCEYLGQPLVDFQRYAEFPLQFIEQARTGVFGTVSGQVFAGLHALDFDTACQAGRLAGAAGCDGIASGIGAALSDRGFTDFRVQNGQIIALAANVPRPYLRVAEIVSGFHLGFAQVRGTTPGFHALGLGTPIMLLMIGALAGNDGFLVADSTAPIKDAMASRVIGLYVDEPAPLKLKAHRIVEFWLAHDLAWQPDSPKCNKFNKAHPPRVDQARRWWQREGRRRLNANDLVEGSPLSEFFPLLGRPADDVMRQAAGLARTQHNHRVIQRLVRRVNRRIDQPGALLEHIGKAVADYLELPHADPRWKAAVSSAWEVVKQTREDIDDLLGT